MAFVLYPHGDYSYSLLLSLLDKRNFYQRMAAVAQALLPRCIFSKLRVDSAVTTGGGEWFSNACTIQ